MDYETPPSGTPLPPDGQDQSPLGEERSSRTGRARERQQRRQHAPMAQPAGSRRAPRQTAPSDRFKPPKINLPGRTWAYAIGSIALVILVVYILGRLRNEPDELPPNAVWIGTEWTYEEHSAEEIQNLAQKLRDNQVGTVYAWVSWLQGDQTWRGSDNFAKVTAFVQQFKQVYPEVRLYGWVSLPVDEGPNGYRLDNVGVQQIVADFGARVMDEFGFDGVHLNVEPVWNNDQHYLALLRKVRAAVGEDTLLSAAVPPDWSPIGANIPVPPLIVPGTIWDLEYKKSVALLVDEMAVMSYNSGLSTASDYTTWMAYQVNAFVQAVDEVGGGTDIIMGIPTYADAPPGHLTSVETIEAAAQGIRAGLQEVGDLAGYVRGAALYAEWETGDDEWAQFRDAWVNG
jgi:hypothetical protein